MIWPFTSRGRRNATFRELAGGALVDVHCHVLPEIDDGPKTARESAQMLEALGELGFGLIAATPHFRHRGFAEVVPSLIEGGVARANASAPPNAPKLVAGAEIAFDDRFFPDVDADTLPRLGSGRAYLLELSPSPGGVPLGFDRAVFRAASQGVSIVLAHVERVDDLARPEALGALRRAGALAQVDLTSLAGKYGRTARKRALALLESGEVDVVATDAHGLEDIPLVAEALHTLSRRAPEAFARLVAQNPAAILEGAPTAVLHG